MSQEIIQLIQELGFPIAVSVGLAFVLYRVIMWLLKDVVEGTLKRFDEKHEALQHRLDLLDKRILEFEREMMDEFGKIKNWNAKMRSDFKLIIDIMMKKEK